VRSEAPLARTREVAGHHLRVLLVEAEALDRVGEPAMVLGSGGRGQRGADRLADAVVERLDQLAVAAAAAADQHRDAELADRAIDLDGRERGRPAQHLDRDLGLGYHDQLEHPRRRVGQLIDARADRVVEADRLARVDRAARRPPCQRVDVHRVAA
jgi:hypothetical protein